MGISIRIRGEKACFRDPSFPGRNTYKIITPWAAKRILEAIYWKPQFQWKILSIKVLNPVEIRSHKPQAPEILEKFTVLRHVDYIINAEVVVDKPDYYSQKGHKSVVQEDEAAIAGRHLAIFKRRCRKKNFYQTPFLGIRGFCCEVDLVNANESSRLQVPEMPQATQDFGIIFHDFIYIPRFDGVSPGYDKIPAYFNALLVNGTVNTDNVQTFHSECSLTR